MPPAVSACRAPRCEWIKGNRCRCPNPWTEFVSKTVSDRKRQGHAKLSRQEYSVAYKEAKDRGDFVPPDHLKDKVAPCKTDTFKLCSWRARRKLSKVTDVDWTGLMSRAAGRWLDKHIGRYIQDRAAADAYELDGASQANRFRAVFEAFGWQLSPGDGFASLKTKLTDRLGMPDVRVERYIAGGKFGSVFAVKRRNQDGSWEKAVVKIVRVRNERDWQDFGREVRKQQDFGTALNTLETATLHVPRVFAHWKLHGNDAAAVLMEAIDGSLGTFVQRYQNRRNLVTEMAKQLKRTVASLRRKRLVHGDLHWSNMGYKMLPGGKIRVYLIDFGRSLGPLSASQFDKAADIDRWCVWRASVFGGHAPTVLNDALRSVGFPGSDMMSDFTPYGSKPHVQGITETVDAMCLREYVRRLRSVDPSVI